MGKGIAVEFRKRFPEMYAVRAIQSRRCVRMDPRTHHDQAACPATGHLHREYLVQRRDGRRVQPGDEPAKMPRRVLDLLAELARAVEHVRARALTATFH